MKLIDYRLAVIHEDGSSTSIRWRALRQVPSSLVRILEKQYSCSETRALEALGPKESFSRQIHSDFAELIKEGEPIVVFRGEGHWEIIEGKPDAD